MWWLGGFRKHLASCRRLTRSRNLLLCFDFVAPDRGTNFNLRSTASRDSLDCSRHRSSKHLLFDSWVVFMSMKLVTASDIASPLTASKPREVTTSESAAEKFLPPFDPVNDGCSSLSSERRPQPQRVPLGCFGPIEEQRLVSCFDNLTRVSASCRLCMHLISPTACQGKR